MQPPDPHSRLYRLVDLTVVGFMTAIVVTVARNVISGIRRLVRGVLN